ncbi:unnamed protein product [Orchesella dallaii]|uniref:C2H2-type domain-containing protein n=1 Tax=Orchesella dallaii TaxID=48710 RepID=A0ABP1PV05_9HEXA
MTLAALKTKRTHNSAIELLENHGACVECKESNFILPKILLGFSAISEFMRLSDSESWTNNQPCINNPLISKSIKGPINQITNQPLKMEESDSDSMSSFDVSNSDNGTGNKEDDSNHRGDAGTGTIKLKCMLCGEAVDSIGELRLHMDTGEFHPNTSSKISFEKFLQFALKDYNNDCISKAVGQAQLLNEEATVEVDSVDRQVDRANCNKKL